MANLYRVSIFADSSSEHPRGLAVWERFGADEDDVCQSTLIAAQREFPAETDLEVWVNGLQKGWAAKEMRLVEKEVKKPIESLLPAS